MNSARNCRTGSVIDRPIRVLQVNSHAGGGGAALMARTLHERMPRDRVSSSMLVGRRDHQDAGIAELTLPARSHAWRRFWAGLQRGLPLQGAAARLLAQALRAIAAPASLAARLQGHEDFDHPASHRLLALAGPRADLVHLHNLHSGYFDLEILPALSTSVPTVVTLHDAWLMTGHCAHSLGCDRWQFGCGSCPDLTIYPAVLRDGTAFNWQRKRRILQRSRLCVATPSHWLMDQVRRSILATALEESRVIPNGVDLSVFRRADQHAARRSLGLPEDVQVVACVGYSLRSNRFKDYATLRDAVMILGRRVGARPLLVLAIGDTGSSERFGAAEIRFVGRLTGASTLASYYQASDLYAHPAVADTYPSSVIEALACGCPVVASAVGGIPEQVRSLAAQPIDVANVQAERDLETATGLLVAPRSSIGFAAALSTLLDDEVLLTKLSGNAARDAQSRFSLHGMIDSYLSWYEELVRQRRLPDARGRQ